MLKRNRRFKKRDGCDSQQELDVFAKHPWLNRKPLPLPYTQHLEYRPDALMGVTANGTRVYLELKEHLKVAECAKYEAIASSNPHTLLCMLIASADSRVFTRLARHPNILVAPGYSEIPLQWKELIDAQST